MGMKLNRLLNLQNIEWTTMYCCGWKEDDCFCQNDMLSSIIEEDIENERENFGDVDLEWGNVAIRWWEFLNKNKTFESLKTELKVN